ncbi:MAG TPA: calcium-binding protein [Tepidisphaeraceae bacterium]|nr:calcium-binding protein [Tepidisphaeraceae bacterium]
MAPNSHIVKWLLSSYRHLLHRNKVKEAEQAMPECLRRPMGIVEPLEQRVMLSASTFEDVSKATYTANPFLTADIRSALVDGLGSFATKLEALSNSGAFNSDVPGVLEYDTFFLDGVQPPKAKNLASIISAVGGSTLGDVIQDEIVDQIAGLAIGTALSTDLTFSASGGGLFGPEFEVHASNPQFSLVSGDNYKITFDITITVTDTDDGNLFFDLGRNADQFGIRPTSPNAYFPSFSNSVGLEAGLAVDFSAGVTMAITESDADGEGDTPDVKVDIVNGHDDFFVSSADLAAFAKIDTSGDGGHVASAMQLGFLDVNLSVDKYKLDGKINLSLNGGGTIPFASIGSITTTTSLPASNSIDADVTITVDNVSGTSFSNGFHAPPNSFKAQFFGDVALGAQVSSIGGSSDPRTAPRLKLNADALSNLGPFKNLDSGAVVGLLKAFADRLGALPASSVLSLPLPLTKGKTLGDMLPLGSLASNALIYDQLNKATRLVDKDGNPQFISAQSLTTKLHDLLGLSNATINPTYLDEENGAEAHKLLFTVGFDAAFDPAVLEALKKSDIGFNIDLGKIAGLESDATVKLTPSGHIGFTFGIDLTPGGAQPIRLAPPLVDAQIRAVLNDSGALQTPANGVLASRAGFKLTVGGSLGGTATVILTPADTAGNTSIDDLVLDLQAKINAAIDAVNAPLFHSTNSGKLLVKVDKLADGRLRLSSPFTTFLQVKKLTTGATPDAGGFAALGFVDGQRAATAPTPDNGILGDDADFDIRIGSNPTINHVHVLKSATLDNTSVDDLVGDINDALHDAGIDNKVLAQRIGSNTTGIMLVTQQSIIKMLQVVDADNITEQDFGWQDKQIGAEIAVAGSNELLVQGDGMAPSNGKPADEVVFRFKIDGGDEISVHVLTTAEDPDVITNANLSNTSDNTNINDLVADINLAVAHAKLPDGRSLGVVLAAGAIDTDHDTTDDPNADSFVPDTIIFRSTANIGTFQFLQGTHSGEIGYTTDHTAVHFGPNAATGQLPAGGATFTLSLSDDAPVIISVSQAATNDNAGAGIDHISALVQDIQDAIDNPATGLAGKIVVGRSGDRILLTAPDVSDQRLRINLDESTGPGATARDVLGFRDGLLARADEGVAFFVQDAEVDIGAKVDIDPLSASAHLGFIGISIDNTSNAHLTLDLKLQLKDNENNTTRIFLNDLNDRLTDIRFTGSAKLPPDGKLTGDATFDITIDGGSAHTITVPLLDPDGTGTGPSHARTGTDTNATITDLVKDIQDALDAGLAGLNVHAVASVNNAGILSISVSSLQAKSVEISNLNTVATDELHLSVGTKHGLLVVPSADWTGTFAFNGINVPSPIPGIDTLPGLPFDIAFTVGNSLPGVASLTPDLSFVPQDLLNFSDLLFSGANSILDAISGLSSFLNSTFANLDFVKTKIPIINLSIADLIDVGDTFKDVLASFTANPTSTIQDLRNRLIEALGLPSNDPDGNVNVSYDPATSVLKLDLKYIREFNKTLPIDFDLAPFSSIPFELKGNAALEIEGGASARMVVGVDLSDPLHPDLFLDTGDTSFDLNFAARGKGINFVGSLGPAGLFIQDGQLALDKDGDVATDGPNDGMQFGVHLDDNDTSADPNDNRLSFADLDEIDVTTDDFDGALNATLPIFFPTDSDFLGNLGIQIGDLKAFITGDTSSVHVDVPDLSNILDNLNFNLLDNLPLLIDGVDFVFGQLQSILDKNLGSLNLPLIGDGLHDAAQFINNLRTDVFQTLKAKFTNTLQHSDQIITDALNQVFGPGGAFGAAGILATPVHVDKSLEGTADDFVTWTFSLGQELHLPVSFDLGLPVLGLKSDSPMDLTLNWGANLGFGIDFEHGFYFVIDDDASNPELTVDATLDLPSITGNLLFLKITAEDNHPGDDLGVHFNLDLQGGTDDKLGLADLLDLDADVSLTGEANIDLGLRAGINAGDKINGKNVSALPTIVADFKLQATMNLSSASDATNNSPFDLDYVAFEDIGLDLGTFFSDFLRPLVKGIQEVTDPLQPFIDVFTSPIPVISDLAGQPVTLLDIAGLFGEVDPSMIEAIANIITLVNSIPDVSGTIVLPFGDVVLVDNTAGFGPASGTNFNLFDDHAMDEVRDPNTPLSGLGHFGDAIGGFGDLDTALGSNPEIPAGVSSFTSDLGKGNFGDFISFPFLNDPSQILGALFGRPFTLVTLDLPPFTFGFTYSQFFPIIGPLGASITGSLGAKFDFAFGYDSFGLQKFAEGDFKYPLDIFRGFYISDTDHADGSGSDVNEIEITGSLVGSAELNLGVAKGSVGGGVKVTFGLNLNDPDHDGKVRIEELINNIVFSDPPFNPLAIFDVNIKVEAFLTWAIEVLFVFKASGQIGPSLPLLDETIEVPHQPVPATDVGKIEGSSLDVLRLNMGPFAGDRLNKDVKDGNETFVVTKTGDNEFSVKFGDFDAHTFSNIGRIEAKGGQGNDSITFDNVDVPILVDLGAGDDIVDLHTSSGSATVTGGSGNDTVVGGSGKDTFDGGDGADLILGGGDADEIHGGGGDDSVSGDGGNDVITGDDGKDKLAGGADNDFIDGGAGDDEIWGDGAFDAGKVFTDASVSGNSGNDVLSGGDNKDTVHGDGGNDSIGGGAAADLIEGGLGADLVYGDSTYTHDQNGNHLVGPLPMTEGGDRIYGESATADLVLAGSDGGDEIHGEAGNDFVRGNSGNDNIFGEEGADLLFGDQNNDCIKGGNGGDIAFGGADNDTVLGEASSDILFGDDGLVVYFGFPNFTGYDGDKIVGGNRLVGDGAASRVGEFTGAPDSDALSRDLFITDVRNSDGDDYVDGAAGNDVAFGGRGNDVVIGDADPTVGGFDPAATATGNDMLFGDGGKVQYFDRIATVAATVTPFDLGGNDTTFGNNGDDIEFGGPGNDAMHGGHGTGFSTAGSDKDVMVGDNGEVDFVGGKITVIKTTDPTNNDGGVDDMGGDEDRDVILGGVKGDNLNGNLNQDVIVGDEGQLFYNLGGPDFDGDITTLDKIETTNFTLGGDDKITGADDNDIAIGGSKNDNIKGDAPLDDPGDDVLIGDQGEVDFFGGNITRIITTDVVDADGGVDTVQGNEGKDVILGGVQGDLLQGNDGDDIILGDEGQLQYNLTGPNRDGDPLTVDNIETLQPALGGIDTVEGNAGVDIAFGGAAGDFVYGDADAPVAAQDGNDIIFGDGGRVSLLNNVIWKLESTDTAIGGKDYMEGNAGSDFIAGGADSDEMHGDAGNGADINAALDGNDIMLGDNALLNWLYHGDAALSATLETGFVFDNSISTLDLITTIAPNDGGNDNMFGNAGSDNMWGGTASDLLVGDNTKGILPAVQFGAASARPGNDLEFGDHGRLYPQHSFLPNFPSRNFFSIDIGFTSGGAADLIFGNENEDVQIGAQGDDKMFGNSGDDDMIGGHNINTVTGAETAIDELKKPTGDTVNDLMDGGTGDDAMAGDNATIWRNGATLQANDLRLRIRTLGGALLYNADGTPNITAGGHNDPLTATTRSVFLLDHSAAIQAADINSVVGSRWGNDLMVGNADDDAMFGQLGSELMQGDGQIEQDTYDLQMFEGVHANGTVTDGNDYIEGNGGTDMLVGNLGQDDIIGGSSQFFGLTTGAQRPDAGDIIFGGAANPDRVKRHAFTGDVANDQITFSSGLVGRHAVDSDFIMGDNANIFRIVNDVGGNTSFIQFNYDKTSAFENRGSLRIVVRAYQFLDYNPIEANTTSIGARDIIHGESGDDFIHGMTGGDILFGDGENDEMFGERDKDWMSGGTDDDAMLGDNGLVLTSRNSVAEPLYGITATTQQFITEPGDFLQYLLNPNGRLKHRVDLEPFDQGNDDAMYGGLGDDVMHGGEGNDGISGAEALPVFYNAPETSPRVEVGDIAEDRSSGPEIRIIPRDGNGVIRIGFYDFVNALPKLANHFLNFENDLALQTEIGTHFDSNRGDGKDFIFGDWGNDWLVGGTGRDHMYGGIGADLLNLDDDLETDGGQNDQPDFGNLIPGDPGASAQVYDNSDFGYGGAGRDVLILNTGADRAEDWVGEYNSYIAPFAPFGNGQVERQLPPSTPDFFYQLSESDGADQTRIGTLAVPAGGVGDPLRRGEPFGEMGLVLQQDKLVPFDFAAQNGAPIDRQAGNTPGGKRDTRGDGLHGGTTNSTAVTSPTVVLDLAALQVIKNLFSYWAESISGLNDLTLLFAPSNEPITNGDALIYSLQFDTQWALDEFFWVFVPV